MGFFRDTQNSFTSKFFYKSGGFNASTPPSGTRIYHSAGATTSFFTVGSGSGNGVRTLTVSGALPPGFTFNESTGEVSGTYVYAELNTPLATYNFSVTSTVTNPATGISSTETRDFAITTIVPWRYRQMISTGYQLGGYQNSQLWNNVNRCAYTTDTTVNLGDGYIDNFHYKSGATSLTKIYIFNGGPTAFNHRTEVKQNSGGNPGGGNNGVAFNENYYAYVNGEGVNQIKKFRFSTESMIQDLGSGWSDHAASISGEYRGIFWGNSGQTQRIIYATDAIANMGHSAGAHGQQKGLMAKTGFGYGGAQGSYNGGYQFRKTNIESESSAATVTKPRGNCGEENFGMGQDAGYMLGNYDGGQNNGSFRITYSTDAGANLGSSGEPKGKGGCSSAHMGWRD